MNPEIDTAAVQMLVANYVTSTRWHHVPDILALFCGGGRSDAAFSLHIGDREKNSFMDNTEEYTQCEGQSGSI